MNVSKRKLPIEQKIFHVYQNIYRYRLFFHFYWLYNKWYFASMMCVSMARCWFIWTHIAIPIICYGQQYNFIYLFLHLKISCVIAISGHTHTVLAKNTKGWKFYSILCVNNNLMTLCRKQKCIFNTWLSWEYMSSCCKEFGMNVLLSMINLYLSLHDTYAEISSCVIRILLLLYMDDRESRGILDKYTEIEINYNTINENICCTSTGLSNGNHVA